MQVTLNLIVAVAKRETSEKNRAPDIVRKIRVGISDPQAKDMPAVDSYSSCVDAMSNIIVTALAPPLARNRPL